MVNLVTATAQYIACRCSCLIARFGLVASSKVQAGFGLSHRLCHLLCFLSHSGPTATACATINSCPARQEFSGSSAVTFGSAKMIRLLVMDMPAGDQQETSKTPTPASPAIVGISKFHNHGSSGSATVPVSKSKGSISVLTLVHAMPCTMAPAHLRVWRCRTSSSGYSAVV